MRISRLYLKIFLAFMMVLIVSEVVVFIFLHLSWSKSPRVNHMEREVMVMKDLVEMELQTKHLAPNDGVSHLSPLLKTLARSSSTKVWITGPYGETVASSGGQIPDMSEFTRGETAKSHTGVYVYKKRNERMKSIYAVLTAQFPEGYPYTYHVFHTFPKFNEEVWFIRAQIILTIFAAIFLIPVSRRMIRPIKNMTETAAKMGRGDLKQRVNVKGKDEIAELAKAFNHMAEGLEKMVKSSRELTANVSHELRSPLARMRISLEMLKEKIEDHKTPGCDSFVDGMQAEIVHMDELIGKIIEFSKLDMKKSPALNETADLKGLIENLLSQYEHSASRCRLNIKADLDELKLPNCNRNGLRIIMDNILGNAFKYTEPEGEIHVSLSAENGRARIIVTNTHEPLPNEDLEEIFNPFHRLKGQDIPGSGLGLAAAQKITRIHNGLIRAENSDDGFRIVVELPITGM